MSAPYATHVATALDQLAKAARTLANPDLPQTPVGHIDVRDAEGNVIHTIELTWAVTHALIATCHQASAILKKTGEHQPES